VLDLNVQLSEIIQKMNRCLAAIKFRHLEVLNAGQLDAMRAAGVNDETLFEIQPVIVAPDILTDNSVTDAFNLVQQLIASGMQADFDTLEHANLCHNCKLQLSTVKGKPSLKKCNHKGTCYRQHVCAPKPVVYKAPTTSSDKKQSTQRARVGTASSSSSSSTLTSSHVSCDKAPTAPATVTGRNSTGDCTSSSGSVKSTVADTNATTQCNNEGDSSSDSDAESSDSSTVTQIQSAANDKGGQRSCGTHSTMKSSSSSNSSSSSKDQPVRQPTAATSRTNGTNSSAVGAGTNGNTDMCGIISTVSANTERTLTPSTAYTMVSSDRKRRLPTDSNSDEMSEQHILQPEPIASRAVSHKRACVRDAAAAAAAAASAAAASAAAAAATTAAKMPASSTNSSNSGHRPKKTT
jgi:hypothetical protein